jgi:hypothetical protein
MRRLPNWLAEAFLFFISAALTVAAVYWLWARVGPFAYGGADGKSLLTEIGAYLSYGQPAANHFLNPLEGMAALNAPINPWLNPVLAPFLVLPQDDAAIASTAVAFICLSGASFLLARCLGMRLWVAVIGAQFAILPFPPFCVSVGLNSLFLLVPSTAASTALLMIAGCMLYRIQSARFRDILLGATPVIVVLAYAVLLDPGWFVGASFALAPVSIFIVLDAPTAAARVGRAAALALCGAALLVLGPVDYLHGLFAYTSRIYLSREWSRPQDFAYASNIFGSPYFVITYATLGAGWLLGVAQGDRSERRICRLALFTFAAFLIEASLYLWAPFDWVATIPVYHEVILAAGYALAGVAGWCALLRRVGATLARHLHARFRAVVPAWAPDLPPALAAVLVAPALVIWYGTSVVAGTSHTHGLLGYFDEKWPIDSELVGYLRPRIGLDGDGAFRGSVLVQPYMDYPSQLTLANFWRNGIPSFNEYNTFQSPLLYYVLTRTPRSWIARRYGEAPGITRDAIRQSAFLPIHPEVDPHFLNLEQSWGVRYVAIGWDSPTADAQASGEMTKAKLGEVAALRVVAPARMHGSTARGYDLYELPDANTGNYSATETVVDTKAGTTLSRLFDPAFNFRRAVILTEPIAEPLVPASQFSMRFERGGIRLQGSSLGTSLVVLPVQFSHCLALDGGTARLLRANLLQAGLLFSGTVDARLSFRLAPLAPGCRARDLADLRVLEVDSSDEDALPWRQRHPHAASALGDFPSAIATAARAIPRIP